MMTTPCRLRKRRWRRVAVTKAAAVMKVVQRPMGAET
jgi:hypothetical protein